jgi:hypothetical protein
MCPIGTYKTDGTFNPDMMPILKQLFDKLNQLNLLGSIIAIYPVDEPELHSIGSEQVVLCNQAMRQLMSQYPALDNAVLAVIYSGQKKYPGIETYDWIGIDDYDKKEEVLGEPYKHLTAAMRPEQRIILVPGGCDRWRQDPTKFADFAINNQQVKMVVGFIWIDNAAPQDGALAGIRSNGMRDLYVAAGKKLTNK